MGKIGNLNLIGKVKHIGKMEIHGKVDNLKWLINLANKVINSIVCEFFALAFMGKAGGGTRSFHKT